MTRPITLPAFNGFNMSRCESESEVFLNSCRVESYPRFRKSDIIFGASGSRLKHLVAAHHCGRPKLRDVRII